MAAPKQGRLAWVGGVPGVAWMIAGGLVGVLFGIALFTFGFAGGWNYFGNDPAACNQCHAMNEQYNAWSRGSHRYVATCNDCHSPHDNIVHKYINKADNGFWHAVKFTNGDYPDNIKIRQMNRDITQDACLYCHGSMVETIEGPRTLAAGEGAHTTTIDCLQCHSNVGHMR